MIMTTTTTMRHTTTIMIMHDDDHDGAHGDDHDDHDHDHADFDVSYGFDCRHPTALKQITLRLFQQLPRLERLDVDMVTTTGQARQRLVSGQNLITLP
jgi:ABC-type Zn2+ transport system substrate-binding protein/surface adhesin